VSLRHCEERSDEAIHLSLSMTPAMDCFASLAMTVLGPLGCLKIESVVREARRKSARHPEVRAVFGEPRRLMRARGHPSRRAQQRAPQDKENKSPARREEPDEAFVSGAPLRQPDHSFRASTYSIT
jgi:hypothetical protein